MTAMLTFAPRKEPRKSTKQCIMEEFLAGYLCSPIILLAGKCVFIRMIKALDEVFLPFLVKADAFCTTWLLELKTDVQIKVESIWRRESDVHRTLGSDGFTGENGAR